MRRPRLLLLYFTFLSLISLAASPGAIYAQVTATWSGGGASGDWNDPANWDVGVPGVGDDAEINGTGNNPTLSGPVTVNNLNINPDAVFTVNGRTVTIGGDLTVRISNTSGDGLIMTNPADELIVEGNAVFPTVSQHGSADSGGNYTAGTLRVKGNFTQTRLGSSAGLNVFVSTGTGVVFDGVSPQTVSFYEAGQSNSRMDDVNIENVSGVTFNTTVYIDGQLTLAENTQLDQANGLSTFLKTRLPVVPLTATYSVFNTHTSGNVVMTGALALAEPDNDLFVNPGITLVLSGNSLDLGGDLTVETSNTLGDGLIMTDPDDELIVNGNAVFTTETNHGSAFSDGSFTDGVLRFRGNFTQTRSGGSASLNSFVSTGTRVVFDGTTVQNIFSNETGLASSRFSDIDLDNPSGVSFTSNVVASGTVTIVDGTSTSTTGTVTIGGDLVDTEGGRWQVQSTDFSGDAVSLPTTMTTDATFSGGGVLENGFDITGDLVVVPNGHLVLSGTSVHVSGNLTVTISNTSGDGLLMTHPDDELVIDGNAVFTTEVNHGSATSDGQFTDGDFRIRGNFTQTRSGSSAGLNVFVSTGTKLYLDGTSPQSVSFFEAGSANSRVDDVEIENVAGVTFNTDAYIQGQMTLADGVQLSQTDDFSTFFATRLTIIPPLATYSVFNTHTSGAVVMDRSLTMPEAESSIFVNPDNTLTLNGHALEIGGGLAVTISNTMGDGLS